MTSDIGFEKLCKRFLQIVENGAGLPGGGIPIGPQNDPIYIQALMIDVNKFEQILKYVKEKNYVESPDLNSGGLISSLNRSDILEIVKLTDSGKNFLNE